MCFWPDRAMAAVTLNCNERISADRKWNRKTIITTLTMTASSSKSRCRVYVFGSAHLQQVSTNFLSRAVANLFNHGRGIP